MAVNQAPSGRVGAAARLGQYRRPRARDRDRHRRTGSLLVAAQFSLIGLCLLPVGPTLGAGQLRPLGLACLALALVVGGLALLAMGSDTRVHPVPHQTTPLRSTGIYAWIRHPMYTAVLLATLGVTLSGGRVLSLAAFLGLMALLRVKANFEDDRLDERFGWEFAVYASRVPAVVPERWRSHGH